MVKVNRVTELIETKNIIQTNYLIKAAGVWVADQLGPRKYEGGNRKIRGGKDVLKKI